MNNVELVGLTHAAYEVSEALEEAVALEVYLEAKKSAHAAYDATLAKARAAYDATLAKARVTYYEVYKKSHPLFGLGSIVTIIGSNGLAMQGRIDRYIPEFVRIQTADMIYSFDLCENGTHAFRSEIKVAPADWQKILAYAKENTKQVFIPVVDE